MNADGTAKSKATVAWLIKTYLARREVAAMLEGEADEYQVNGTGWLDVG